MSKKEIEIEADIPIPEEAYKRTTGGWDLHLIPIGRCAFYAGKTESKAKTAITNFRKSLAGRYRFWRFFSKDAEKDGVKGVRVWRMEDEKEQDGPEPKRRNSIDNVDSTLRERGEPK